MANLTKTEILNIRFLAEGNSVPEIAASRHRSASTVSRQIESARYKLFARNSAHLVAKAFKLGLLNVFVVALVLFQFASLFKGLDADINSSLFDFDKSRPRGRSVRSSRVAARRSGFSDL